MPTPLTSTELIKKLIAYPTVSNVTNLDLIGFIEDYLASFDIPSKRIVNKEATKANLYATLGPQDQGGIVLSGHTDVVPVAGQDWSGDPFHVREHDQKLYGRGTADMKSFIAICLAAVPQFLSKPLQTPIHFAFSYDEELGCLGVRAMINDIITNLPRPKLVIVGEPTNMKVVDAHKACYSFQTSVKGREAHSSMTHLGVNAIVIASHLITELTRITEEIRTRGDETGRFDPPYTTVSIGMIEGGSAVNIVPNHCQFSWDIRTLPGHDPATWLTRLQDFTDRKLLREMRAIDPAASITTEQINAIPALAPDPKTGLQSLILKFARQNETEAVSYGTEAGLFQAREMPAFICGPGDIRQAHRADEFITLEQIKACEAFVTRLADFAHTTTL